MFFRTLLTLFRLLQEKKLLDKSLTIIPIRNYKQCKDHKIQSSSEKHILEYYNYLQIYPKNTQYFKSLIGSFITFNKKKIQKDPLFNTNALSEISFFSKWKTETLRFDIYINQKHYMSDVQCDGIVISTKFGCTGYYKSITNTIFKEGIGIAFSNSPQHISNLVLNENDIIQLNIKRGEVNISYDNCSTIIDINGKNQIFEIKQSNISFSISYREQFMCQNCRNKRHSAYVNDIYNIL